MNKKNKNPSEIELLVDDMKKRNLLPTDKDIIQFLETALDYYCITAKRDIFIIPPAKKEDHIIYLMEEIMETVRMICKQIIENKRSPLVDGMRFDKFFQKEFNKVKESYVN